MLLWTRWDGGTRSDGGGRGKQMDWKYTLELELAGFADGGEVRKQEESRILFKALTLVGDLLGRGVIY